MNFLEAPLVTGIVFFFIYMIFELFARKDERIRLIEKMGQSLGPIDSSVLKSQFSTLLPSFSKKSFTALRMGCLLVGLGLGLLIGLFLCLYIRNTFVFEHNWERDSLYSVAYGAPVLIFGGIGLITSYLIERKDIKKDEK
jgi:hypothetical protein